MTKDDRIKDMMRNIPLMIDTLRSESEIVQGHRDPRAYHECWRFLMEDVNELIKYTKQLEENGKENT